MTTFDDEKSELLTRHNAIIEGLREQLHSAFEERNQAFRQLMDRYGIVHTVVQLLRDGHKLQAYVYEDGSSFHKLDGVVLDEDDPLLELIREADDFDLIDNWDSPQGFYQIVENGDSQRLVL